MAPKPKWSETDAKGLTWIYNYVKSLPGYSDARKEDFMCKYNKKLLGIISQNTKWTLLSGVMVRISEHTSL